MVTKNLVLYSSNNFIIHDNNSIMVHQSNPDIYFSRPVKHHESELIYSILDVLL